METSSLKHFLVLATMICVTSTASVNRVRRELSSFRSEFVQPWRTYFIAYACERTMLDIHCSDSNRIISLARVTYGRQRMTQCNEGNISTEGWSTSCMGSPLRAQRVVSKRCNGRRWCKVPAVNYLFGDPCPNTYKYLEVYYACVSADVSEHGL